LFAVWRREEEEEFGVEGVEENRDGWVL